MSEAPVRPRRRNRKVTAINERPGSLFESAIPAPVLDDTVVKKIQVPQENIELQKFAQLILYGICLLYTSPSPRDS